MAGGGDRLLCNLNSGHRLLYDRAQIIIWHPAACSRRGVDGKTFHHWVQVEARLGECQVELTPAQQAMLREVGMRVANRPRG